MKIAYFITGFGRAGAERLLCDVSNNYKLNHAVEITYFKGSNEAKSDLDPSIPLRHIPLSLSCVLTVRKYLKRYKPDLVHTHFGQSDFIALTASAGLGIPTFCTFHNVYIKNNRSDHFWFFAYRILLKYISRKTHVFCISKAVYQHVLQNIGLPKSRVTLLYNGIPDKEFSGTMQNVFDSSSGSETGFLMVYAGRFTAVKNPLLFIRVFERLSHFHPGLRAVMLGDGPERQRCEEEIRLKKLGSRIDVKGVVSEIDPYLLAGDVFVSTSLREGFGMVIIEAMRAGIPVVAPDVEGPQEILDHQVTGLLYPPGDETALENCIQTLIKNPDLRDSIKKAARASFLSRFEIRNHLALLEKSYGNALPAQTIAKAPLYSPHSTMHTRAQTGKSQ